MGSIDAACIAGFLCRLCSEMHRTVIHIYGNQGQKHGLAQKINEYLPVTITPTDPLPKTICETCMTRVEQHHDLMLKIAKTRRLRGQMTITTLLRNEITQTDEQPSIEIVATRNVWNSGVIRQNSTSSSTTISAASSDNRLEDDTVVTTREPTAITTATSISASADMLVDDATETETSSIIVPLNNSNSISDVIATEQLPANANDNL